MACPGRDSHGVKGKKLREIAGAFHEKRVAPSGAIPERAKAYFSQRGGTVEVWPENRAALELYQRCQNWRMGAMGGAFGLERTGIESTMNMMGIPQEKRPALLDDIIVMEQAALAIINRKKA